MNAVRPGRHHDLLEPARRWCRTSPTTATGCSRRSKDFPIGEMAGMPGDDPERPTTPPKRTPARLHRRRHRVQHLQHGPQAERAGSGQDARLSRCPRRRRWSTSRAAWARPASRTSRSCAPPSTRPQRANVVLLPHRRPRPDGHGAGRRRHQGVRRAAPASTPATPSATGRASFNDQQETLYHAGRRHRRQGAARQQRPLARHRPGAEGYCQLLHPRLLQHQRRPGRPLPPHPVRLASRPQPKLDYRSGYFAAKVFKNFNAADKERQLEEALQLGDPVTDLPLALEVNYFRLDRTSYFVPLAVKVPASLIALARKGSAETAELDFIGQVRDTKGTLAGTVRDSIKVKLTKATAAEWASAALEYDTGFTLPPGDYRMKFLARENQERQDGHLRNQVRGAGPEQRTGWRADQFGGLEQPARAAHVRGRRGVEQQETAGGPSAGPRRPEAGPEHHPGVPQGPKPVRVLRGLRPGGRAGCASRRRSRPA